MLYFLWLKIFKPNSRWKSFPYLWRGRRSIHIFNWAEKKQILPSLQFRWEERRRSTEDSACFKKTTTDSNIMFQFMVNLIIGAIWDKVWIIYWWEYIGVGVFDLKWLIRSVWMKFNLFKIQFFLVKWSESFHVSRLNVRWSNLFSCYFMWTIFVRS